MVRIQRKQNLGRRIDNQRESNATEARDENVLVKRKVPLKHIVQFTRLLATMTEAGLPVLRNLRILSDQWPAGRFRESIVDAADMVEEGQTAMHVLLQHTLQNACGRLRDLDKRLDGLF